jgi:hypothetical protein
MRRGVLLLCAALALLAGCGRPAINAGSPLGPEPPGGAPAGGPGGVFAPRDATIDAPPDRNTGILIAVLRTFLGEGPTPYPVVYVLDHTEASLDERGLTVNPPPGPPIAGQREIAAALADVATVRFVPSRDSVVSHDGCEMVQNDGILITLSRPVGDGNLVNVQVHGHIACLGAKWLTYVVRRSGTEWQVTGTTGVEVIS